MLFKLIVSNIKTRKVIPILTIISISISMIFSLTLLLIYSNIEQIFIKKELWEVNYRKFEIMETQKSFFSWKEQDFWKVWEQLKNNNLVEKLYEIWLMEIPTTLEVSLMWFDFSTDTIVFSISEKFYNDNNINKNTFWISDKLIDLYNNNLWWNSEIFPKLDSNLLKILKFDLEFWKWSLRKYENTHELSWSIWIVNWDLPFMWITISDELANEIIEKIWWEKKLIKVIWLVKDEKYIDILKSQYWEKFQFKYDLEEMRNIKNQLESVRLVFIWINLTVLSILLLFIIFIIFSVVEKNKNIEFVFKILWWSKILDIRLLLYELWSYIIISSIISWLIYMYIQYKITNIDIWKYLYNVNINYLDINMIISVLLMYLLTITILWIIIKITNKSTP